MIATALRLRSGQFFRGAKELRRERPGTGCCAPTGTKAKARPTLCKRRKGWGTRPRQGKRDDKSRNAGLEEGFFAPLRMTGGIFRRGEKRRTSGASRQKASGRPDTNHRDAQDAQKARKPSSLCTRYAGASRSKSPGRRRRGSPGLLKSARAWVRRVASAEVARDLSHLRRSPLLFLHPPPFRTGLTCVAPMVLRKKRRIFRSANGARTGEDPPSQKTRGWGPAGTSGMRTPHTRKCKDGKQIPRCVPRPSKGEGKTKTGDSARVRCRVPANRDHRTPESGDDNVEARAKAGHSPSTSLPSQKPFRAGRVFDVLCLYTEKARATAKARCPPTNRGGRYVGNEPAYR